MIQNIADKINNMLAQVSTTPQQRQNNKAVWDKLQRFEQLGWHEPAWREAVESEGWVWTSDELTPPEPKQVAAQVDRLLTRFMVLSGQTEVPNMFNVDEAAVYLDMTPRTIKHHHHVSKKLQGRVIRDIFFTQDQLDAFAADPPQVGRPSEA